jgi:DnaJ-domain-containing protein 1
MLYKNIRSAPVQDVRVTKLASAADELLGAIDLNLGATENANTQEPTSKIEPRVPDTFEDKNDLKTAINIGNQDLKTVSNVITEFSQDLKEKVLSIESHLQMLGQVGNKLRHSVSTLQDKSAQMRASAVEQSEDIYDAANSAPRGGPLDQLQDAFFALKQQGIRLYLAILDNHSSKQLALETEQLNLLVERIELAVSKMRASLAQALDQASDARAVAPQVSPEVVELLNMDAKQAIRDLDLWQQEFDGLSRAFVEFKRDIKA